MPDTILKPDELQPAAELARKTLEQLDRILLGRREVHRLVLIGVLSRGHILLEGLPGLGKTALVKTIGQILKLDFKRIQFTPDLLPSDVTGVTIFDQATRKFEFHQGPIFASIVLASGLLVVGWNADGAERWISLVMLAIITFSVYIGGLAWGPWGH